MQYSQVEMKVKETKCSLISYMCSNQEKGIISELLKALYPKQLTNDTNSRTTNVSAITPLSLILVQFFFFSKVFLVKIITPRYGNVNSFN